jgi:hypothetical protein
VPAEKNVKMRRSFVKKPFQTCNCLESFAFGDQLAVHINEEVEHEAVDDGVNLEVNAQAVQDAASNVLFL